MVLGLIFSLVPVFSASASVLEDGQSLPDGIYFIRNWRFNDYLKVIDKEESEDYDMDGNYISALPFVFHEDYEPPYGNTETTLTKMDSRFLWKVEYIGDGQYAITSMFMTNFMLTPGHEIEGDDGVPLCVMSHHKDKNGYIPIRFRWEIRANERGYVIQWYGQSDGILAAEEPSGSSLPYVMGDSPNSGSAIEWEFIEAPEQILFYNASGAFEQNPVRYIAPEQVLPLAELGLDLMLCPDFSATQQIDWTTSDDDIADIYSSDGEVVGISYGECTITATYTKDGHTISNSYTLKVAPLPEGEYFISNRESENLIDSEWNVDDIPEQPYLNSDFNGMRPPKWMLVHVEEDKYHILMDNLETENNLFYLAPSAEQNLEADTTIKIYPVTEESEIPCWTIGVTEDSTYTIKNAKNETLCIQQVMTDEENGTELRQVTVTNEDNYDEWVFERANSLRIQVYFDSYVHAYDPGVGHGVDVIEDNHLAVTQKYYWEQFRVSIDFLGPTYLATYYLECPNKNMKGECECSNDSECQNSGDINNLSQHHHTNISNILLRVPVPQDPVDLSVLFIGHPTCYVSPEVHLWRSFKGLIMKEYGLIAVNNVGFCKCNPRGDCICGGILDELVYSVQSSTKTLIHEIGHLFGAVDHYGNGLHDVPSSDYMNKLDANHNKNYCENCIYGENKETQIVLAEFMLCEECRKNIADGVEDYFPTN